jgi:outer membrane protein assembly factor BamE (lipoprotein component of BamABCDE complex)
MPLIRTRRTTTLVTFGILLLSGCVMPWISREGIGRRPDAADIAPSMIVKGKTTKKEILDRFGPPDLMMRGSEIPSAKSATVWTYQTRYTSEYAGDVDLLLLGGSSAHEVSDKSYLIVYFNQRDIVTNFVSRRAGANQNGTEK